MESGARSFGRKVWACSHPAVWLSSALQRLRGRSSGGTATAIGTIGVRRAMSPRRTGGVADRTPRTRAQGDSGRRGDHQRLPRRRPSPWTACSMAAKLVGTLATTRSVHPPNRVKTLVPVGVDRVTLTLPLLLESKETPGWRNCLGGESFGVPCDIPPAFRFCEVLPSERVASDASWGPLCGARRRSGPDRLAADTEASPLRPAAP